MVVLLVSSPIVAETTFNGFGSLFVGTVIEGNEFLADYPKAGVYDRNLSLTPDSSLGVQFSSYFTDNFSLTSQVVVYDISDFSVDADWMYLNYHVTPEISVQLGRKRLPLYYYSDFLDLGYAYYWIRPPTDMYTWQITNYNGISLLYEKGLGEIDAKINLYYGNEESTNNELLGLLLDARVHESWKDMVGLVGSLANEWVDIRLSFMQGSVYRDNNGVNVIDGARQQFIGLSVNLTLEELQVISEFNNYVRPNNNVNINTYMLSFAYQLGDFTPHITRSDFEQEINLAGFDEKHHTTTIGVRWDFYTDTAFKIQYDNVVDEGIVVPIKDNSKSISLGMDFVF